MVSSVLQTNWLQSWSSMNIVKTTILSFIWTYNVNFLSTLALTINNQVWIFRNAFSSSSRWRGDCLYRRLRKPHIILGLSGDKIWPLFKTQHLIERVKAVQNVHIPSSIGKAKIANMAKIRLKIDKIVIFNVHLLLARRYAKSPSLRL